MNKVILIGRLGRTPEVKSTKSGTSMCNFSLATTEVYKGDKKTEWHNIVVFGKTAEIVGKYLKKGSLIGVEGKIQTRSWDDADGHKRYTTEVIMDRLEMLGGNESSDDRSSSNDDDDIPF